MMFVKGGYNTLTTALYPDGEDNGLGWYCLQWLRKNSTWTRLLCE